MEWYWWVLIGIGIIALCALKLTVFKRISSKKNKKINHDDED